MAKADTRDRKASGVSTSATPAALRTQIADALAWGDARVTFEKAVDGVPTKLRGQRAAGLPHSVWELVEHMRIAQADILEFCVAKKYREKKWPDAYWPKAPAPSGDAWRAAIAAYRRDRREFQRLVNDPAVDLLAAIPNGSGQTYLREALLVLDHSAYHIGQVVLVRQALGCWPS